MHNSFSHPPSYLPPLIIPYPYSPSVPPTFLLSSSFFCNTSCVLTPIQLSLFISIYGFLTLYSPCVSPHLHWCSFFFSFHSVPFNYSTILLHCHPRPIDIPLSFFTLFSLTLSISSSILLYLSPISFSFSCLFLLLRASPPCSRFSRPFPLTSYPSPTPSTILLLL